MIGCINEVLLRNEELTAGGQNMKIQNVDVEDKQSSSNCHTDTVSLLDFTSVVRALLK